jgi:predicted extracellular nuclease
MSRRTWLLILLCFAMTGTLLFRQPTAFAVTVHATTAVDGVRLNEIYVNPPDTDDNREYIEVINTTGGALTLTGLWLLEIEGDGTGSGVVDNALNLSALATGSNGLLLVGDNYTTAQPWGALVDGATTLANLSRPNNATIENGTVTFLLVTGFTGAVGNDLDTDNNGTLDTTPWTTIVDSVGWSDGGGSDRIYSAAVLSQSSGTADAATRFLDNSNAESAAAWYNGDIEGTGLTVDYADAVASANLPSGARLTPGSPNVPLVLSQAPTIQENSATPFLNLPDASPGFVSGVLDDPTDPSATLGIDFTIADADSPVGDLTVTATSGNQSVVPDANLTLTGSDASRNLTITPAAVGEAAITVTVSDGDNSASYVINYAASAASTTPTTSRFHTGASDASTAIAIDNDFMLVADDEDQTIRVYDRNDSGLPLAQFDFTANLNLDGSSEVDIEGATRVGNRIYWQGSHGNNSSGADRPNRERIFSTDLSGTGAATTLTFVGSYPFLEDDLLAWDNNNGHGLGANFLGLAASAADGIIPESADGSGFNIEGLSMAPDGTTAYVGFRAPLLPTGNRTQALIVPVTNYTTIVDSSAATGSATFGAPIQLDLSGRGIRSLECNANGCLIIAGAPDGSGNFAIFTWSGNPADAPELRAADLAALQSGGSFESIVELPAGTFLGANGNAATVQLLSDNGDTVWYANGVISKELAQINQQKFRSDIVTLGAVTSDTTAPTVNSLSPADDATDVAVDTDLVITFDESVQKGSGNITIHLAADDSVVQTIDVTSADVTVSGAQVTINSTSDLAQNTDYYVNIAAGAIQDLAGNAFAGLSGNSAWNFTTASATVTLIISEIAPWSSSTSVDADWFEVTNVSDSSIDITGWKMDDSSASFDSAVAFSGVTSIAPGQSVIFVEGDATRVTAFVDVWFGGTLPSGVLIGTYSGSGVGLGTGGDAVNLFNAGGALITGVTFGASPSASPFATFDNVAGGSSVSTLSVVGVNGAYSVDDNGVTLIGSPGTIETVIPGQAFPLSEGFDDCTLTDWEIVSVDADAANTWSCNASFSNSEANGFGDSAAANEWLITPPLDMTAQDNEQLTFRTQTSFTDSGIAYPQLSVKYSTDYDGGGDPTTATWTDLTGITFSPSNSGTWTDSGVIDLSALTGSRVHFAFQYRSSGTGSGTAARWRLDSINFSITPQATAARIYEIQGSGADSPLAGQAVQTSGIVVADFQGTDQLNGFFLQDTTGDGDPATSDGIFVANTSLAVAAGDIISATGTVTEINGLTQLINVISVTVQSSGNALPAPAQVTLPETTDGDLERYEGMYVQITDASNMVVAQNYFLGRYGQITLSAGQRLYQPTNQFTPGSTEATNLAADNAKRILILDDGQDVNGLGDNPNPVPYIGAPTPSVIRGGDSVTNLIGVLDYGRINSAPEPDTGRDYRLHPTTPPVFTAQNARTTQPDAVGGTLKVAAFNVLNYFNGDGNGGGFPTARGADTASEFDRQRTKIITALVAIDADVVGLIEIENDGYGSTSALQDLVNGLNAAMGAGTYALIDPGVSQIGSDEIAVALIYKPGAVTPMGAAQILDSSDDPTFLDTKNRPALAQSFQQNSNSEQFTVAVNHFKSKGSDCDDVSDPDTGDGQGNCNLTRTNAATALATWLATNPTGINDPDFLIIGDLNAYAQEDPITALKNAGYTDLINLFLGDTAYSYTFDGMLGYLDHALTTASLTAQVTGATVWHINTDEPEVINYDENFNPVGYYAANAFRSSDHDPVIIGLNLATQVNEPGSDNIEQQPNFNPNFSAVLQNCAAINEERQIHTLNPTLRNTTAAATYADLYFRVRELAYTTDQGGNQPSLCNATTVVDSGRVGSILSIPNANLPGSDSSFDPGEDLTQSFVVGLPVQARYRIFVDLFSSTVTATGGAASGEQYLGSVVLELDPMADPAAPGQRIFLPSVSR